MANFSADQVYALLSQHRLTEEQRAVIEGAPLAAPALVIAGAGSGKTELMTVRVLYLVANQLAKPEEILGLTFTRKAASELAARVNQALYKLRETELWPENLDFDFLPANITTYNSFGNEIFRRLALAIGFEQDANLLSEAGSIALADELLKTSQLHNASDLESWEKSKDFLIELVLQLAGELTDNQASAEQMKDFLESFIAQVSSLPQTESGSTARYGYTEEFLAAARQNQMLADLAHSYQELKAKRNLVDFSDQVALALKALSQPLDHPYKFVLLDEYQDTSSIQTQMLARLFAATSVLAVGDPNQAIYGWRGASSNNISNFHEDFLSPNPVTFTLSRSWRSGPQVVAAANKITESLESSNAHLDTIRLEPGNPETQDEVSAEVFQDEHAEALAIADWFSKHLSEKVSAALLVRTKSGMPRLTKALEARGIEVEVTGLSSLIQMPEVVDLISALNVVFRPQSGVHLMRILSGAKYRIGPKDLAELSNLAKRLDRIRERQSSLPITIVEALDELRFEGAQRLSKISETGQARMISAAELFARIRKRSSLTLTELCWAIVRELEIDIELFAHSNSPNPLANLESFISRVADFENSSLRPSPSGLLAWLDHAKEKESFELPKSGAKRGLVQLMSVHAAKGLEWDLVAVAGLNQGSFPIDGRGAKGWLASGKLPFKLRGDSDVLPRFEFENATTQRDLKKRFDLFQDENRAKALLEERRLAYVAITRAKNKLLLTASHYKQGVKKSRALSPFLVELLDAKLANLVSPIPETLDSNPLEESLETAYWPADPLGIKRGVVEEAVKSVEQAAVSTLDDFIELTLLLEERDQTSHPQTPEFPKRISASALMKLFEDPDGFAQWLLRPTPALYKESARVGTAFHANLEEVFKAGSENQLEPWDEDVKELGANFSSSRFAGLNPAYVEQTIEIPIAGIIVVCKIDAIFQTQDGYEIIDWKSGKAPKDDSDLARRAIQLALYRIAFSKWQGAPLERIRASFFFAGDGIEVSPQRLLSEAELASEIDRVRKARRD